ncbi:LOW QUALITY PROTEIN: hypothetical protein CVT26_006835 [Gymnopilus dilepis]|uniref:Uncharacterized protein n=1 Tax=Gymnopilus dilepis TaxID=231916 RepID=A0A409VMX2_9AGAR|nr:LOW QUALITY PROTEIN: hypothetical protein CVT26_006835 [Gymnopilus dilepis]
MALGWSQFLGWVGGAQEVGVDGLNGCWNKVVYDELEGGQSAEQAEDTDGSKGSATGFENAKAM